MGRAGIVLFHGLHNVAIVGGQYYQGRFIENVSCSEASHCGYGRLQGLSCESEHAYSC